jgi:antitoxin ChpS
MIAIHIRIRKQGGVAVMTIPARVLKMLNVDVGSRLQLDASRGSFTVKPAASAGRKRYTLKELLCGVTPKKMAVLDAETAWAREGNPVGHEFL